MKDNNRKVPKLRFPGFTDDWEQRKLIDLLSQPVSDGPHETPDLVEEGIPFISVDAIVDNKIDFDRKRGYITEAYDLECRKKYSPQRDDVYLVKSGATVGKVAIVDTDERFNIWSPLAAMRANKELMLPKYLYFYLQLKDVQDEIYEKSIGGTQPNLSMRVLEQFNIRVPHIDEQEKISDALSNLDNLITLHQRKLDQMKIYKKGMLQKMFPQNGESEPEIRFPGFTGAWEQRKLKDLAEFNPKSVLPDEFEYVDLESVVGTEMVSHRTETKETAPSRAQRLARTGDLFYQTVRPYQRNNYLYEMPEDNYVFSTGYAQMRPYGSGRFLLSLVQTDSFVNTVLDHCTGTSYPAINSNDLSEIEVYSTSNEDEQKQIGNFFSDLDNLITLHQRKCDLLKNYKKGLLQQMFV